MLSFEPSGQLLTDLEHCISNNTAMAITYTDRHGISSTRVIAPLEIRNNSVYIWSLEKNGNLDTGLRLFLLANISSFEVVDQIFDKENFKT